jgi:hypothetical protein
LEDIAAPELIEDFYSTAIQGKTSATKYVQLIVRTARASLFISFLTGIATFRTTRMVTFPKYLVVHLKKYIATESGLPKKLGTVVAPHEWPVPFSFHTSSH